MNVDLVSATQVLERTPAVLGALLGGLSPAWTEGDEGPESWSPRMVVAHLIHAERNNWIPRARVFLRKDGPRTFSPFDQAAPVEEFAGAQIEALLDTFARLRAESLATIAGWGLDEAEFAATAEHPRFGTVTLRQMLAAWVAHDLAHIAQVSRVMARQYRDEVGPWRAFLPILDR
ncbi:DinB family protein [Longimicrobium terrae]|uniref:DinB-like domain-containing protein n=1 Tax=Longimicrobium terrae TaxID=1639882 RepID=A0A841GVC9_9BACT|nr:DinB family protein [Longimicrobium terrae]MBB4634395.1 hypothetical protein [Longimicrobium terrae]MBB6068715.1 hypothetical protein [Longimicrobium terrae]NNC27901.1 DinB family protein [Longimicrobium terrae]